MNWVKAALTARLNTVGNTTRRDDANDNYDWANSDTGKAEATRDTRNLQVAAAEEELAARTAWEAGAKAEAVAAQNDINRAQALLKDLVEEIAPLARAEVDARNKVAAAEKALADAEDAKLELGDEYDDSNAADVKQATGAHAVLRAALVAKASVDKQQEFHEARAQWAADNLAPVEKIYNGLVSVNDDL